MSINRADESVLQTNPLFSALTPEQLTRLRKGMRVINLKSHESLFETHSPANRFFILVEGQIKLFRLSLNGMEKIVELIRPGDDFATAVMFMEIKKYPLSADAIKDSRVLSFENRQFLDILRDSPETSFRMMVNMSRRLRWQLAEIDKLSLQTAPTRLSSFLLENAKTRGDNVGQVNLDAPKQVIASRLSIQPETFSRILRKLSLRKLIQVKGRSITSPDMTALEESMDEP